LREAALRLAKPVKESAATKPPTSVAEIKAAAISLNEDDIAGAKRLIEATLNAKVGEIERAQIIKTLAKSLGVTKGAVESLRRDVEAAVWTDNALTKADRLALRATEQRESEAKREALDAQISLIVKMGHVAAERAIEDLADTSGKPIGTLRRLVKAAKREAQDATRLESAGRPLEFRDVEPWDEPVDGAALLEEVTKALGHYVVMNARQALAVALWVIRTHAHEAFDTSPILAVLSKTKRSGKS